MRVSLRVAAVCLLSVLSLSQFSLTQANDDVDGDVDVSESDNAPLPSSSDDVDVDVDMSDPSDPDMAGMGAGAGAASAYPSYGAGGQQYTLDTLPASGDLSTTVHFPAYPRAVLDNKYEFGVGEEVTMLLGVANNGPRPYNLTFVSGALHSPYDYTYYIQNFTLSPTNGAELAAGGEITLEYKFKSDPALEPLQFQLDTFFFYNSSDDQYIFRENFFNQTVTLVDKHSSFFDSKTLFSYLLIFGVLGGSGYLLYMSKYSQQLAALGGLSGKKKGRSTTPKVIAEWEAPQPYVPANKSKAVAKKRSQKN